MPRPELPEDVVIDLPRAVRSELRQHTRTREIGDLVARALVLGSAAVDEDVPEQALEYLAWAKEVAPRAPVIREALGVAQYLAGDFRAALNELRTYARLSGRADQQHVVADCLRATGAAPAEVGAVIDAMLSADVAADRQVEGIIVWASALVDAGEVAQARAVLRRADAGLMASAGEDARDRLSFVTAEVAARAGEDSVAREILERLAGLPDDPYDAAGRLAELGLRG